MLFNSFRGFEGSWVGGKGSISGEMNESGT